MFYSRHVRTHQQSLKYAQRHIITIEELDRYSPSQHMSSGQEFIKIILFNIRQGMSNFTYMFAVINDLSRRKNQDHEDSFE